MRIVVAERLSRSQWWCFDDEDVVFVGGAEGDVQVFVERAVALEIGSGGLERKRYCRSRTGSWQAAAVGRGSAMPAAEYTALASAGHAYFGVAADSIADHTDIVVGRMGAECTVFVDSIADCLRSTASWKRELRSFRIKREGGGERA